jgi:hypothetical protein
MSQKLGSKGKRNELSDISNMIVDSKQYEDQKFRQDIAKEQS